MSTIRVGATDAESLRVTLLTGNTGLDMRTVSSCVLKVKKPDGSLEDWATTLEGATQYQVVARHTFDAAGLETALVGSYLIEPRILTPASRRCSVFKLHVAPYPTP